MTTAAKFILQQKSRNLSNSCQNLHFIAEEAAHHQEVSHVLALFCSLILLSLHFSAVLECQSFVNLLLKDREEDSNLEQITVYIVVFYFML